MPHKGDQQVPSLGHITLDPTSAINPFFGTAPEDLTEEEETELGILYRNDALRINAVALRDAERARLSGWPGFDRGKRQLERDVAETNFLSLTLMNGATP